MKKDFLLELNEHQRAAAACVEGPLMVIAGAGSGKTRTLTYRVAHLVAQGIDPFHILCLTFTNKAAQEMKMRIMGLVGNEARNVWMGTFHSVFARILRADGHLLGYPSNYAIYDTDDSKSVLKGIVKTLELDPKEYAPNYLLGRISAAKSNLMSAQDYNNNAEITEQDRSAKKPLTGLIYSHYQSKLFKSSAMDFDDLLFNTNILLRDHPDVLYKYQDKFRYILVDEYQDTNYSQYIIVKKLASRFENICVVGDDAQSIYAFRGANIQNILNFRSDYPDYKLFKLEQNYRSTKNIVEAANSVIANNKDQIAKVIWTDNETGNRIKILKSGTDNEEGTQIANTIFELKMNEQQKHNAFAILYRTHSQSRPLEEALRRLNIPYRIYGGQSFYSRKEIKDLLAYFRLAVNHQDEEALRRIINYPARGIGDTSMQKVTVEADKANITLWDVLVNHKQFTLGLGGKISHAIENFVTLIQSYKSMMNKSSAYELAMHIAKSSGLLRELDEDKTIEGISRLDNIEALLNAVQGFVEREPGPDEAPGVIRQLDEFMQEVSLLTDQDSDEKNSGDKVSLMTIHQAKGLEYPYVFIAGLEENLFPSYLSINTRSELEEERRLFYVALTRAEKRAYISYAESRYRWGQLTLAEPSRFIDELDDRYVDKPENTRWGGLKNLGFQKHHTEKPAGSHQPTGGPVSPPSNFKKIGSYPKDNVPPSAPVTGDDFMKICEGMRVRHTTFGEGTVMTVEGAGPNRKASVKFDSVGMKQLLLRFAKLVIVN